MKKINQYKLLAGICALSLFTACDFEELNTNPFEMTDEMGIRDGVAVGGAVMAMQRAVITVGTQADDTEAINQYQVAYNLSADSWSGFSDRIITGIVVATILPITYRTIGGGYLYQLIYDTAVFLEKDKTRIRKERNTGNLCFGSDSENICLAQNA